tara:strand:- start:371 stop:703 length:333 start_codon:yes stop_codon:yes gene_type:complete
MTQDDLFDSLSGIALRDKAIRNVAKHTDEQWKEFAQSAVLILLKVCEFEEFTTDEVWELMPPGVETHDPRAMGAIMLEAAKSGLIVATDKYQPSKRAVCHRRPLRVWTAA